MSHGMILWPNLHVSAARNVFTVLPLLLLLAMAKLFCQQQKKIHVAKGSTSSKNSALVLSTIS
jgi:hypothetical protein